MTEDIRDRLNQPFTPTAMLQILHKERTDLLALNHIHDIFFAEQIIRRKADKGLHDTCAIAPKDVRPMRYAERTPEDRLDCKPVCKTTDGRRQESVMNR